MLLVTEHGFDLLLSEIRSRVLVQPQYLGPHRAPAAAARRSDEQVVQNNDMATSERCPRGKNLRGDRKRTDASNQENQIQVIHQQIQTDDREIAPGDPPPSPSTQIPALSPAIIRPLIAELKKKLQALEVDLERLQHENALLRLECSQGADGNRSKAVDHGDEALVVAGIKDRDDLKAQLSAQKAMMNVLDARYQHLDDKAKQQAHLYRESLARLEDTNAKLFDAQSRVIEQRELLELRSDQTAQIEALRKEIHTLRKENAALNDTITMLSSRPFDNLTAELQKKNLAIAELEELIHEIEGERTKAVQEAQQVQRACRHLRDRIASLEAEVQELLRQLHGEKQQCEQLRMENEVVQLQLRFYIAPPDKALLQAFGQALREMKKQERSAKATIENADTRVANMESQHVNESIVISREHTAKVAELAVAVQVDRLTHAQRLNLLHAQEVRKLHQDKKRLEARCGVYRQQIEHLHKSLDSSTRGDALHLSPVSLEQLSRSGDCSTGLGSESSQVSVMEISFTKVRLFNQTSHHQPSFLLLCDYFDFEAQCSPMFHFERTKTPLHSEKHDATALVDFDVSFKVSLAEVARNATCARIVFIELKQFGVAEATTTAVGVIALDALFSSQLGHADTMIPLFATHSDAQIGSLKATLRMDRPIATLFASEAFQHRKNVNAQTQIKPRVYENAWSPNRDDLSRSGVMSVRVIGITLIKSFVAEARRNHELGNELSLAYQFMGFPRATIVVGVPPSSSAVGGCFYLPVDDCQSFEFTDSRDFLQFLEQYEMPIQLQVLKQNDSNDSHTVAETNGTCTVNFGDVLHATMAGPNSRSVLYPALSIADNSPNRRVLGRLSLEVIFSAASSVITTNSTVQPMPDVKATICSIFGGDISADDPMIDWVRLRTAVLLSPLPRAIRQLLLDRVCNHNNGELDEPCGNDSLLIRLGKALSTSPAELMLSSWEDLDRACHQLALPLNRMDIVFILAGLRAACRDEAPSTALDGDADYTESMRDMLLLICQTSRHDWLEIEGIMRHKFEQFDASHASAIDQCTPTTSVHWSVLNSWLGLETR